MSAIVRLLILATLLVQVSFGLTPQACGAYKYDSVNDECYFDAYYPWFAAGAGWQSLLSVANPQSSGALVSYRLMQFFPFNGTNGNPLWVKASVFGNPPIITQSLSLTPAPNQGFDVLILDTCYTQYICEDDEPPGVTKQIQAGAIWLRAESTSISALDAQRVNQLVYAFANVGELPTLQTSVPLWRDSQLSPEWLTTFTETATPIGRTDPASVFMAIALLNVSDQAQAVAITIQDQSGNQVGSMNTPIIPPHGTIGFLLVNRYATDTLGIWPSSLSLPSAPDGLFHGSLDFRGTAGGNIVAMANRWTGNTQATMIVAPILNGGTPF